MDTAILRRVVVLAPVGCQAEGVTAHFRATALTLAALTPGVASAQSSSAPDGPTIWGGLSSEVLILPTLYGALSLPLTTTSPQVALRGGVQYLAGEVAFGADLLLGAGARGLYGGPSGAVIVGTSPGWMAGALVGYRNTFSGGRWGYFVEGKARYLFLKDATTAHHPGATPQDLSVVSPGLGFGLTYRF